MKLELIIEWKEIRAVERVSSKDETRYILNGVYLEITKAARAILVATDGRRLIALLSDGTINDPSWTAEGGVVIPSKFIHSLPQDTGRVLLTIDGNRIRVDVMDTGIQYSCDGQEGNFPNWRQVIPEGPYVLNSGIALDVDLLDGIMDAARILMHKGNDRRSLCRVYSATKPDTYTHPPFIIRTYWPELFAVLMPIRTDADEQSFDIPSWVDFRN